MALAVLAVLVGGLLAGLSLDRSLVALPAWRRLDVEAWAAFSRHADLGRGLVLYPALGVGGPLLSLATAVAFVIEAGSPAATGPVVLATLLSIAHLVATARAAPAMFRARERGREELARAFARFERWQAIRATLQTLTFVANLWVLVALLAP